MLDIREVRELGYLDLLKLQPLPLIDPGLVLLASVTFLPLVTTLALVLFHHADNAVTPLCQFSDNTVVLTDGFGNGTMLLLKLAPSVIDILLGLCELGDPLL